MVRIPYHCVQKMKYDFSHKKSEVEEKGFFDTIIVNTLQID